MGYRTDAMGVLKAFLLATILASVSAATSTAATPVRLVPYDMIVRVLDETAGKYEVEVENMNPKRFISGFNWTPPAGLNVTAITGTTGGKCLLLSDGTVACKGQAAPPDSENHAGESLIVDFSATGRQW